MRPPASDCHRFYGASPDALSPPYLNWAEILEERLIPGIPAVLRRPDGERHKKLGLSYSMFAVCSILHRDNNRDDNIAW